MSTLTSTSTLAEIDAALAAGEATLAQVKKILAPRSKRDSASGRRAAAWLQAHDLASAKAAAKAALAPPAPPKAPAPRLSDGRLVSEAAWALRAESFAKGEKITYADAKVLVVERDAKAQGRKGRKGKGKGKGRK